MRNLIEVIPWILSKMTWLRDWEIHQWKEILVIYDNSKCKLCGEVIPAGEICMAAKGIGILHKDTCFNEVADFACLRDNIETSARQSLFNYYRKL